MLLRAFRGQPLAVGPAFSTRVRSERACRRAHTATRNSLIRELQADLADKKRTAVEITEEYIDRLERLEASVNSFLTVDREGALAQAAEIDARIADGGVAAAGALAGVPVAVKDNICTAGVRTTAGSKVLGEYVPAYDATATAALKAAGAVIVGKTNMDEFGMGSSTENSGFKPTKNPWGKDRVPGGSSGGSGAAVAANQCVAALGSDTGGSIRLPAAFCGCVGLKPTYGRVSRFGLIAYASSLDCIGPLTQSVEDAALLLNVLAGPDERDATSAKRDVEDFTAQLLTSEQLADKPLAGKKVGIIAECMGEGVDEGVQAAIRDAAAHFESLGATVEEVSLPSYGMGLPAYYVLATSEASSNLSRYDGVRYGQRSAGATLDEMYGSTRADGLGAEVKRRILMGTYALSAGYYDAYYKQAQKVRTLVREQLNGALADCDVLLSPTCPSPAYKMGEKSTDPLAMYKGDLMTININLSGLPGIALPCGFTQADGEKLPVGMQLVAPAFQEAQLLSIAHAFEQTAEFARGTPELAELVA